MAGGRAGRGGGQEPWRPPATSAEQVRDTQGAQNSALPPPHHDPTYCESTSLRVGSGGLKATLEQLFRGPWPRDAGQWE